MRCSSFSIFHVEFVLLFIEGTGDIISDMVKDPTF